MLASLQRVTIVSSSLSFRKAIKLIKLLSNMDDRETVPSNHRKLSSKSYTVKTMHVEEW